jgi:DNA-binding Lrp family transcriptional regulator
MPTLSAQDRRVLQTVLLQAEVPVEKLARAIGTRVHTFRRTVAKLQECGVLLGKRAFINPQALGLLEYHVYLKQCEVVESQRKKFIQQLSLQDGVGLLAELSGDLQYEVRLMSRSVSALMGLADALSCQYQLRIEGMCQVYEQEYSGPRYDSSPNTNVRALCSGPTNAIVRVDETDHQILSLLANTSYESMRSVAQVVGIPSTTLTYRINRLERSGVISGYYYLCDVKPVSHMPTILLMQTRLLDEERRKALRQFCKKHPQIAYLDIMLGEWGARALMRAEHHQQVLDVVHELTSQFSPYIESVRVMPQLRFHRFSTYPFVNFEAVKIV